jgi:hypothetical protein
MMTGKRLYAIVNIDSGTQDDTTGDRTKTVVSGKKIVDRVDLVGVNTAQLGQAQGFNFSYSVEIYRILYHNEKYLYFDGEVYEVKGLSKAKDEAKMLLNVQHLPDADVKQAIEQWLGIGAPETEVPEGQEADDAGV